MLRTIKRKLPNASQYPCSVCKSQAVIKAKIPRETSVAITTNIINRSKPIPLRSVGKRLEKKLTKYTTSKNINTCSPIIAYAAKSYNIPAVIAQPRNAENPSITDNAKIAIKTMSPAVLVFDISGSTLVCRIIATNIMIIYMNFFFIQ